MWKNGRIYTGMWSDNKMNGKGKFTWPDGSSYDGGYKNDKKEGHGTFRWGGVHKENGILMEKCVYEGQWANGKQNGKGKLTWGDGQGVLKDGKDGKDVKDSRENWTGPMLEGVWEEGKLIKTTKRTEGVLVAKDDKLVAYKTD
jgi:hypothetical protein